MAFYSIHNLLDAALGKERTVFDETTIYVTINQAIDALEGSKSFTTDQIKPCYITITAGNTGFQQYRQKNILSEKNHYFA